MYASDADAKAYHQQHYERYKPYYLDKAKRARLAKREWLASLKAGKSCINCGETHPACLEFHHRDPAQKAFVIADKATMGRSKASIRTEVAKCDILCANCHRKLHWSVPDA